MDRTLAAAAMVVISGAVAAAGNWWVQGPGTEPVHGEAVVEADLLPEIDLGQRMSFVDGENATALVSGWSTPEPTGVWSLGKQSMLGLRIRPGQPIEASKLVLQVHVYLAPPTIAAQHVVVWAGRDKLGEVALDQPDEEVALPLTGMRLPESPKPVLLTFILPDAISPYDARGDGDYRILALELKTLSLVR